MGPTQLALLLPLALAQAKPVEVRPMRIERSVDLACPDPFFRLRIEAGAFEAGAPVSLSETQRLALALEPHRPQDRAGRLVCSAHQVSRETSHEGWRPQREDLAGRFDGVAAECISGDGGLAPAPSEDRPCALELIDLHGRIAVALEHWIATAREGDFGELDAERLLPLIAPPLPHDPDPDAALVEGALGGLPRALASALSWPELEVDGTLRARREPAAEGQLGRLRLQGVVELGTERNETPAPVPMFWGAVPGDRWTRWSATLALDGQLTWTAEGATWESSCDARLEVEVRQVGRPASDRILESRSRSIWTGPIESRISSG